MSISFSVNYEAFNVLLGINLLMTYNFCKNKYRVENHTFMDYATKF